jgi:hypothetical protein
MYHCKRVTHSMEDKWRIPFTLVLFVALIAYLMTFGSNLESFIIICISFYLFVGLIICAICFDFLSLTIFFKLLMLWFPSLWNDNIRDFITKQKKKL